MAVARPVNPAHEDIGFGFSGIVSESENVVGVDDPTTPGNTEREKPKAYRPAETNIGLGTGPGGQIARSFLAAKGAKVVDGLQSARRSRATQAAATVPEFEIPRRTCGPEFTLHGEPEPPGMFMGLLLNDESAVSEEDLMIVRNHRWTFYGAEDLARQGKSFCYLIWCLLDLQRNVQLEEDGDALDQKLARACKTFVSAQCRDGKMGSMYQLLTHFISNAAVFHEWDRFLRIAFEDQRANQESFLVPHLEQVWTRFSRFRIVLEGIFDVLNSRFVWRHRLPPVGDIVHEHMKKRCFSRPAVTQNELISQASSRNETIKQVKYAFGLQ
eukprot:CAMPEP_0197903764 /NCGR_PEP_ID=MMETSP1439-20131203/56750_1 /TAXON_ID=66791 /ORGANISM="Gonyaulax spinifera, Strain CCMP409" /LENGTH=326 /DNA_ID=CAMNT_0043524915 /DNA_START=27 /DNA_END=1007 /DNA_ORIENTATION=+